MEILVRCSVQNDLLDVSLKKYCPFFQNITSINSQNTLDTKDMILDYFCYFLILEGWMIFGLHFTLHQKNIRLFIMTLLFTKERNVHNLIKDFKDETIGYENSLKLIEALYKNSEKIYDFLPLLSSKAFDEWKKTISKLKNN